MTLIIPASNEHFCKKNHKFELGAKSPKSLRVESAQLTTTRRKQNCSVVIFREESVFLVDNKTISIEKSR